MGGTQRWFYNDPSSAQRLSPFSLFSAAVPPASFGWFLPRTFLSHTHPADMSPQKSKLQATPFSLPPGHRAATAERSGEAAHVITPKPKKEMRVPPGVPPTHGKQERRQSDFRKMRRSSNFRVHSSCLGAWPHPLGLSLHHQGRGDTYGTRPLPRGSPLPASCGAAGHLRHQDHLGPGWKPPVEEDRPASLREPGSLAPGPVPAWTASPRSLEGGNSLLFQPIVFCYKQPSVILIQTSKSYYVYPV